MAPVVRGRKGEFKDLLDELDQQGFRARVDGEVRDLSEPVLLDRRKNHTIEAIIDRILLKPYRYGCPRPSLLATGEVARPAAHLPARTGGEALDRKAPGASCRQGPAAGQWPGSGSVEQRLGRPEEQLFSSSMACPDCGLDVPKLEPRSFSLQLHLWRLPGVPRAGLALRLRSGQGDYRLVKAAARWRAGPGFGIAVPAQTRPTCGRPLQDRPENAVSRICPPSSSTFWSTARPRARRRAPAFTAFCATCATPLTKRAATAIAST